MNIVDIDPKKPDINAINKAARILKSGGLVVYPTDTAYGLGANALDEQAVRKMYEAKGRDFSKPTHVVAHDWEMVKELCFVNKTTKKLCDAFLPGPLTIILPKRKVVPDILTAGLSTLGIRIPNNQVTKLLSNELSSPYTTPSANKSGGKTPYSIEEVKTQLDIEKVDLILDAGELPPTPPSTIIDLTKIPPEVLREGPIKKTLLEALLKMSLIG